MERIYTLCLVEDGDKILLARKKRKIGVGLWNGYGGKLESKDKSIEAAAKRELRKESCGLKIVKLDPRGILHFLNGDQRAVVHVFHTICKGTARETVEMGPPEWFPKNALPYDEMLPADQIWLPVYLQNHQFVGEFEYTKDFTLVRGTVDLIGEKNV